MPMTTTDTITAYIDRLRHRAAQMDEHRCAELRDEAMDRIRRRGPPPSMVMADALERSPRSHPGDR